MAVPPRTCKYTHTYSTYGQRRIKRRSRNIYTSFYLLRLPEYLHINTDVSVYSNRVNIVSIAGVSRDKRRNIAHTRHPSAVIKCRVMIDEPLLVICCFKVPPRLVVGWYVVRFRRKLTNSKFGGGREKKGEKRGARGEGRNLGERHESSSFILGWIKLDGREAMERRLICLRRSDSFTSN